MFEAILSVPVIVKVFGALFLILVVNRFCRHLIVSVAVGTLALGLWSGHSGGAMLDIAWTRLSSVRTLFLMLIVFQVIWLSSQMSATGIMKDLADAVRARMSQRGAVAVLPAVIGLLPMPGGALFSAPLVESCDADGSMSAGLKAQTNHWFRHIWEYWWPLYPGVLIALEITGLEVWEFMLVGVPLCLCAVGAGYVFLLRRVPQGARAEPAEGHSEARPNFFALMLPIMVVIGCYAAIGLSYAAVRRALPEAPPLNRYIPMVFGLFGAMLVLQRQRPIGGRQWRNVLLSKRAFNLAAIVATVTVYGAFIEAKLPGGGSLVENMESEMAAWGIPMMAVIMLVPMVAGLSTGLSVGFVGASFPIVISLLGEDPPLVLVLSTTVLYHLLLRWIGGL